MTVQAPKRWSVSARAEGAAALRYHCAGQALQADTGMIVNVSPVEHLLLSIAGCFALSCRAVIAKRGLPPLFFEVVVSGSKAPDYPSRLAKIEVLASFEDAISAGDAQALAAEAKTLCTVSNSIAAAPAIDYVSRIVNTCRSAPAAARSDLPA